MYSNELCKFYNRDLTTMKQVLFAHGINAYSKRYTDISKVENWDIEEVSVNQDGITNTELIPMPSTLKEIYQWLGY